MLTSVAPACARAETALRDEFQSLTVAKEELPPLTDWGVEDFSETVHSLGIHYLALIGRRGGWIAVPEYPVRLTLPSGQLADGPIFVKPDVVWWNRESRQAELIAEFERYEPGLTKRQILQEKVRNLLLAHRALGPAPRSLVLVLWTVSGMPIQGRDDLTALIRSGFNQPGGVRICGLEPESRFHIFTAVFASSGGRLRLREVLA